MNLDSIKSLLEEEDVANITTAISAGGKVWENELIDGFKAKFKAHYRTMLNEQCCYCKKNSSGEFKMVLDIEHVLPKSSFRELMFESDNLSISCKRCNMNIKGEKTDFVVDLSVVRGNYKDTNQYKFIHPNLDDYFAHLSYRCDIYNDKKLIKYSIINSSPKGEFTYKYFKLIELEIDSINVAQGIKNSIGNFKLVEEKNAKKIRDLLNGAGI